MLDHVYTLNPMCCCSFASYKAQERIPSIQGTGGVYFAGAWCSYGFHEDGIKSAVAVAELLGAGIPWTPIATSPKMGLSDMAYLWLFNRFAKVAITIGQLRLILPNGEELLYGSGKGTLPAVSAGAVAYC